MKLKIITILMIVLFLSSSTLVQATKIQKDDTWKYKDKDNKQYNEKAIDVIQLTNEGYTVSTVEINTDRLFIFDMNLLIDDMNIDISYHVDNYLITQEGGIPYISNSMIFDTVLINGINKIVKDYQWYILNDATDSLLTTTSTQYSIGLNLIFENEFVDSLLHWKHFIISSNSDINNKIKTFSITPYNMEYRYFNENNTILNFKYNTAELNNIYFDTIMELTYEENIILPTHIVQKKDNTNLKLSSMIEYILINDDISTEDQSFFPMLSFLIAIPILIRIINIKN